MFMLTLITILQRKPMRVNFYFQVIHCLLDLPCLTAALELLHQASLKSDTQRYQSAIQKFSDPRYKPLYSFILRNQSGRGDTIDR